MARLQLNLSDTSENLISRLMPLCDLRTKTDVVENALMLLGWAATEASQGRTIAALEGARGYKTRMAPEHVAATTSPMALTSGLKTVNSG
jgi:hypothetical protein